MTTPADSGPPEERVLAGGRAFDLEDQRGFAELSGDFNPMHVDPVRARRLLFGDVVVHGIHSALWALDRWAAELDGPVRLTAIRTEFPTPLPVGVAVDVVLVASDGPDVRLEVRSDEGVAARVRAGWTVTDEPANAGNESPLPPPGWSREARDRTAEELDAEEGRVEVVADPALLERRLPALARRLNPRQAALILATTRLVGMEVPGLHSLFTRLTLTFTSPPESGPDTLAYRVTTAHPRTGLVRIRLDSHDAHGEIQALVRPRPVEQLSAEEAAGQVEADEFAGVEALVVGGSRGLGEVAAKLLAAGGASVVCTYARGREDAERVVREIEAAGGRARAVQLDVLDASARPPTASHLLYFASPRIRTTDGFDRAEFERYCDFYLAGFLRVAARSGAAAILYPSTVFVERPPSGFESYAAAKRAGESVCEALGSGPGVRVRAPRLPRLRTDQTAGVVQVSASDPTDRILSELRGLCAEGDPAPGET